MREQLTSIKNQHVKNWKKLATKRGREKFNAYLLDGWHLVEEALKSDIHLTELIGTAEELATHEDIVSRFDQVYEVTPMILKHVMDTVTPQGIAAVAELPDQRFNGQVDLKGAWLMLDRVQDPGNVGTMVRTADAAGFAGVIVSHKSADLFNPKVVRSMQGSQFHLKLYTGDLTKWIQDFKAQKIPVYGTQLNPKAKSFRTVNSGRNFALIMGNEGHGMAEELLAQTTANLYIPMKGEAESLNVAISAGILMFELNQQALNE
ncbi:RNA methyltransferase [Lactobacillus alvi]|uniref:RNA methyltransferase n=1 Tax=Limosilactobacillus alvi TaxID=990412 RepID=A0ABS2EQY7_9LACO|nr:RNA methyltransferase [Limosilactobacillus alvi]MBM6754771.1 RNA methyltransferase [Limosilactobacillus alvi]